LFENKRGDIDLLQFVASASFLVIFQTSSPDNIFLNKKPIYSNRYIYFFHYGTQHAERLQGLEVFPLANIAS